MIRRLVPRARVSTATSRDRPFNAFGIQLLPPALQNLVFSPKGRPSSSASEDQLQQIAKEHLRLHRIPFDSKQPELPVPQLPLRPEMRLGEDIDEHMARVGEYACGRARQAISSFHRCLGLNDGAGRWSLAKPDAWSARPGWTKYECATSGHWQRTEVSFPDASVIVFDVETAPGLPGRVTRGNGVYTPCRHYPIMAVARSATHWYSWTAPALECGSVEDAPTRLIPLGTVEQGGPVVVIGHNVAFDRARVAEEYAPEVLLPTVSESRNRRFYLDTLSLHCAIGGISNQQRGPLKQQQRQSLVDDNAELFAATEPSGDDADASVRREWMDHGSMNNLHDAVLLHCQDRASEPLIGDFLAAKKDSLRSLLSISSLDEVRHRHADIVDYCARDVGATVGLFFALWPRFLADACPHPVSLGAVLEMASRMALPVRHPDGWLDYIHRCQHGYERAVEEMNARLVELVEKTVAAYPPGLSESKVYTANAEAASDPWLCRLDWTPTQVRLTKAGKPFASSSAALAGKPAWYKGLFSKGQMHITVRTRVLPYLLRLRWKGHPVYHEPDHGWCYGADLAAASGEHRRIPHPGREGQPVGSILCKAFLPAIESGQVSTSDGGEAASLLRTLSQLSSNWQFWTSYQDRIQDQMVIWQGEPGTLLAGHAEEHAMGLIIPKIIPMGTVTRRAVESTWMTASNSKPNMAGSELKSRIVAPAGHVFVGADVDSQEIWIAGILGDAQFGQIGATALAWMTLQGTKAAGTDLHSRTAAILGMSRDAAKIFNYGRVYGAGVSYAAELLCKFNPQMAPTEAKERAKTLYAATKGAPAYGRKDPFVSYAGGSESFMFNAIESMARAPRTVTPCLGAQISAALRSSVVHDEFLTSRVNWVVQSSGVDYLHLLVTQMRLLCDLYSIPARLLLTIHDEVRFLTPIRYQYRTAFLLQLANLWTRAFFAHRLGIDDLPLSVAFFSAVDIDAVLRKDPSHPCTTMTSPAACPPGVAVDIHQLLEKLKEEPSLEPSEAVLEAVRGFRVESVLEAVRGFRVESVLAPSVDYGSQDWARRLERLRAQVQQSSKAAPPCTRTRRGPARSEERPAAPTAAMSRWDANCRGIVKGS